MQDPPSLPQVVVFGTTMLLSLAVLFYLWQKHKAGRPLLDYEPRRSVPWNLLAPFLAIFISAIIISLVVGKTQDIEDMPISDFIFLNWTQTIASLSVVAVGMASLATFYKADAADLGLPKSLPQFAKDCWLGFCSCLAAMLPVYSIQLALWKAIDPQVQHPLIEKMQEQDAFSLQLVLVGMGVALVAAPIFEEFVFRLLFQGWLEKWEDSLLNHGVPDPALAESNDMPVPIRPALGMLRILPHGWLPIAVSGLLFGLAHLGHGVAPVPLTLLGIVLGYLYQRTHRLLPCIVAHMLFNGFSMVMLWLQSSEPPV
jgi:membrane protease YdiL (CAAX protease family)